MNEIVTTVVRDKWRETRSGRKVTICRSRVGDRSLQMVIEKGSNAEQTYLFIESKLLGKGLAHES